MKFKSTKFVFMGLVFTYFLFDNKVLGTLYYTKVYRYLDPHNRSHCTIWSPMKMDKSLSKFKDYWEIQHFPGVFHNLPEDEDDNEGSSGSGFEDQRKPQVIEYYSKNHFNPTKFEKEIHKTCDHWSYQEHEDDDDDVGEKKHKVSPSDLISPLLKLIVTEKVKKPAVEDPNVMRLVYNGEAKNRIDVVFMGDGYTQAEREKFFEDVSRLVNETLRVEPFEEYLPIMNVYARFTPSVQSGIGYNGIPKNTYFKLYRYKGSALRGIYLKNLKRARRVCNENGPYACDFPVIIANDPFYGGIGGEFAISTSSHRSGALVLRHELGHVFAKVGEEYDGGEVYVGANSSPSLSPLKWDHWIDEYPPSGKIKEERSLVRIMAFPTADLLKKNVSYGFTTDGSYGGWYMIASLSGAKEPDSVMVHLDGKSLDWKTSGSDDKKIHSWINETHGLSKGRHNVEIFATKAARNPSNSSSSPKTPMQVGSVSFFEIGHEGEYHMKNNFISAYPTWDYRGQKQYRPTSNGCLMRNMTHDSLCSICKESIWLQFLRRTSLMDSLEIEDGPMSFLVGRKVKLHVLPLGEFRTGNPIPGEHLDIRWSKNNVLLSEFDQQTEIRALRGKWEVTVTLVTPRVRKDVNGYLQDKKSFNIS